MGVYQGYPIADFRSGKVMDKAPWLVPSDAWATLLNGRIVRGVLEKRLGQVTLDSTGASLPIMGIFEARYQGVPRILVLDTKRVYSLDLYTGTLTDLSEANTFTGGTDDYFRFCTYYSKTYWVNGINQPYSWDEATDTIAAVDTAGALTISTCNGLFMLKSRLHFVAPTISGVYYPDRIYYTDVGTTTITNATQYYTYERDDVPVGYSAWDMNVEIILGRKSAWRVEYTGDTTTPFRCATVDAGTACLTPQIAVDFDSPGAGRMIATLSRNHWVGFDGYRFRVLDWPLRGLTDEMDPTYLHYCQGVRCTEKEALYFTYPQDGETYPNRLLEYSVDENHWCEHDIAVHCLAAVSGEVDPTNYSLGTNHIGRMARGVTLAGDRTGNIYQLDIGDDDNGTRISLDAFSAALNPFQAQRRKAYLGWIEVYVDNDSTASFTLSLYKDDQATAYKTIPVSCAGSGDRFWQRVNVGGEVGVFHRMRIENSDIGNRPRIHALMPWFKPGGLISNTNISASWPNQTWRLHYESGATYIQRKESGSWVNYQTWGV